MPAESIEIHRPGGTGNKEEKQMKTYSLIKKTIAGQHRGNVVGLKYNLPEQAALEALRTSAENHAVEMDMDAESAAEFVRAAVATRGFVDGDVSWFGIEEEDEVAGEESIVEKIISEMLETEALEENDAMYYDKVSGEIEIGRDGCQRAGTICLRVGPDEIGNLDLGDIRDALEQQLGREE